jgi:hypothetical protein
VPGEPPVPPPPPAPPGLHAALPPDHTQPYPRQPYGPGYQPYPPQPYPPQAYPPQPYPIQPYPSQPYPPQVPPPLPRKSRTGLWIGLGIGALVLVCCLGGVVGFGGLIWFGIESDKQASVAALEDHLDAIVDREYGRAYDVLCESSQREQDLAEFERQAEQPRLVRYRIGEVTEAEDGEAIGHEIEVDLTFADGATRNELYFVYTEGWDVYEYTVCPLGD